MRSVACTKLLRSYAAGVSKWVTNYTKKRLRGDLCNLLEAIRPRIVLQCIFDGIAGFYAYETRCGYRWNNVLSAGLTFQNLWSIYGEISLVELYSDVVCERIGAGIRLSYG